VAEAERCEDCESYEREVDEMTRRITELETDLAEAKEEATKYREAMSEAIWYLEKGMK
jgi:predicted  nucleic acid-binding Zn-ribbon protein